MLDLLRGTYRPEFLNRLDELVIFNPLQKAQLRQIARLGLADLSRRLAQKQMSIEVRAGAPPRAPASAHERPRAPMTSPHLT